MKNQQPEKPEDPRITEFLGALFADLGAQFIELRTFPANGNPWSSYHSTPRAVLDECRRQLKTVSPPELFFGVCPRRKRSGKKDAVRSVVCLWSDLDPQGFPGGKNEMLSRLRSFPLAPTAIIDSGNGLHAYWRLREAEQVTGPEDIQRIESCLRGIAEATGGDRSVAELARIMRVPGTLNLKDRQNPKPVQILELNPARQYNLPDFDDWVDLAPVAHKVPMDRKSSGSLASTLQCQESGKVPDKIPLHERNSTLTSLAGTMRRRSMSEAAICAALLAENAACCAPPLDDAEVRRIAQSVGKYSPAETRSPTGCHRTEIGNAQRLVANHGADLRHVGAAKRWYVWDGRRWGADETGEIYRRAKETIANIYAEAGRLGDDDDRKKMASWAMKSETEKQIKAMIALAQSDPLMAVRPDVFDTDPWLLSCANGTLDLRTGSLRPHRREDHITRLVPAPYVPDASCPQWDAFLSRVTNGDVALQGFLKRAVGYSLTGDASEQVMFILYGTGQNGKSKFLEVLRLLLGDYALNTATKTLLVKTPGDATNDLARLYGARLVTAVEWEDGQRFAESLVKQVTGGDVVTARFLHKEFFDFVPTFKLFLATNHKPPIRGTDFAIWRRIRLIPFLVTIPEEERDKHIVDKLRPEFPGILRWAVEGCLEWRRDGLGESPSVREATSSYRIEMDVLGRFLGERCVESAAAHATSSALYKEYVSWCGENGETAMTQTAFGMRLAERGFDKRKIHGIQNWHGIGLRTEETESRGAD